MPLFWISCAFLLGIILGEGYPAPSRCWLLLAVLSLALVLLRSFGSRLLGGLSEKRYSFSNGRFGHWVEKAGWPRLFERGQGISKAMFALIGITVPLPVLLSFVFLGALRFQLARPPPGPGFIAWYNDTQTEMAVVGVVVRPPDARDTHVNLRVEVERVRPADDLHHTQVEGTLLARVPPGDGWRYGDRLVLQGALETPPEEEDFSYRDYLARQGVYAYMPKGSAARLDAGQGNPILSAIFTLKERALDVVYQIFPDPEASLMAGILLGVETGIPPAVQQAFKDTGTSHVIAISGFNMTILAGLFAAVFCRVLGLRWGALAAIAGIALYTVLVGADAAVVRAAIMGGLSIFARQVGRRQAALNSLALTAATMALFTPQVPWDVGFQLSFGATLGLVLYADPFSQAFVRHANRYLPEATVSRLAGPVGEYFLFTLAAQVTTLPVTVYHFRRLSLSSFLANPLILPVQPAVMILGGIAVLLGLIALPIGTVAGWSAWPFVVFTIRAVELVAKIPGGVLHLGQVRLIGVIAFYALLFIWTLAGDRLQAVRRALTPALVSAGLAVVTVLTWRTALGAPDGRLHMTLLDVGRGDAILIQTADGRTVLIDGGGRTTLLSEALGRRLPLGRRRLHWLVVAAPFPDQIGGLPGVLPRFPPDTVLWAGPAKVSRPARQLGELLMEAGIPVTAAAVGQALDLGAGARLEVLAVGPRGAVLLLTWARFRALLPVGLDFNMLKTLDDGRSIGPVTVLLLSEGGYAPLNQPVWIRNLQPQVTLISVGVNDYQELPAPETLAALDGYAVLRTDENGWIEISTDGEQMWLEVQKER